MQNYAYARGGAAPRGPRREGPAEEGFVRHPRFLFDTRTNVTTSCHHCRPTGLAHIPLFTQFPLTEMVRTPKFLIGVGRSSA